MTMESLKFTRVEDLPPLKTTRDRNKPKDLIYARRREFSSKKGQTANAVLSEGETLTEKEAFKLISASNRTLAALVKETIITLPKTACNIYFKGSVEQEAWITFVWALPGKPSALFSFQPNKTRYSIRDTLSKSFDLPPYDKSLIQEFATDFRELVLGRKGY